MLTQVYAAAVCGVEAFLITAEVNAGVGMFFNIVGLPDNAIKESKDRIQLAITNSGLVFPRKALTVNLSPADIRKEGTGYDLPIAVGVLVSSGLINEESVEKCLMMGELSLGGVVKRINGALPITLMAKQMGFTSVIMPKENIREASVVDGIDVYGAETLNDVIAHLNGERPLEKEPYNFKEEFFSMLSAFPYDFKEVCGQETAKRALEVAVAGGHNIIMIGSPGSGKSMLAKRIPTIMPTFTFEEALETTKIHSVAGKLAAGASLMTARPFRSPHNNVSSAALLGGGSNPQPGEISLAHNGVLFLDELPQYSRSTLEELRQPLEDRKISISRAKSSAVFPASFMLVAAMNPCPCGNYGNPYRECTCSPNEVQKYMSRISGPLLDRIDIQIQILPVSQEQLMKRANAEESASVRARVEKARAIQRERFKDEANIYCNAQMERQHSDKYCNLDEKAVELLKKAMEKLRFSGRGYEKILKLSRTIADLEGSEVVEMQHVKEALSYRNLDRENWGR